MVLLLAFQKIIIIISLINLIKFSVVSTNGNLISTQCFSANINNGSIIDIPVISEEIFNNQKETNVYYDFGTNKDIEIDVELIPDYPNQLCYDGKSYAVAYGLPILTEFIGTIRKDDLRSFIGCHSDILLFNHSIQ